MTSKQAKSNNRSSLLASASTVGGWTLLSRILGFVRDILLARVLGAGPLADAFFVAFKLPNFFRRMFAEGTLTVAMVPVLTDAKEQGEAEAHRYLNALATLVMIVLIVFTVLGVLAMPWLLRLFAPGFIGEPDRWEQALLLARWMFPYLTLISLAALAWGVLNTYKRFSLAAATPALLNIGIILAALLLAPLMDNAGLALALGVLLGGMMQLLVQLPALRRIGWIPSISLDFGQPRIRETLRLFGPAVLAITAVQINILVGTILATLLEKGAVSYLYYADRIIQLPLALFGIAMSTALLPALSSHLSKGNKAHATRDLRDGLAWLTWLTLPAMAGAIMLAKPIVITLFEHGVFTHTNSLGTAATIQAYAVGLIAFCWAKLLATACYASKDAKAPMKFAAISVAVNIMLAVLLMQFFSYVGLALATSLASFVNVALLYFRLQKRYGSLMDAGNLRRIGFAVLASIVMLIVLYLLQLIWPFPATNKAAQILWLTTAMALGLLTFFSCALGLGERHRILDLRHPKESRG
ncbi:MAG: murein biosynthesis integral membrane protein MurJ [Zetaproteobacteria bacterium]|nr:MAG: murein biosynthesis integral membrane protein MurJ [Zetaproteobacteria bacterium]